ncbi:hypothetical protein [Anseongella ginsenosidimutans]|uniref:hypothetical protein n=1 Tax=Anseongella ginsenosidimutans TaxID=496056 RepID=UPI0011CCD1CA|nr:hypothetical protein [Anseongella ginsenosidimutans]QEC53033.1 hypothetical protein FRZ59_12280 [Anseongella ginsenosidimutans]
MNVVYRQREELLDCFEGLSVFRRGEIIQLNIYNSRLSNEYFFLEEKNNGKRSIAFLRDSLQFDISTLRKFSGISKEYSDQEEFRTRILPHLLDKMQELNIVSFTSEFSSHGVTLKIYLQEYELLVISNINAIKNDQWRDYIQDSSQIDDHWFWRKI